MNLWLGLRGWTGNPILSPWPQWLFCGNQSRLEKLANITERSSPVSVTLRLGGKKWSKWDMCPTPHSVHISAGHPRLLPVQWLTLSRVCRTLLFFLLLTVVQAASGSVFSCARVDAFPGFCSLTPTISLNMTFPLHKDFINLQPGNGLQALHCN